MHLDLLKMMKEALMQQEKQMQQYCAAGMPGRCLANILCLWGSCWGLLYGTVQPPANDPR